MESGMTPQLRLKSHVNQLKDIGVFAEHQMLVRLCERLQRSQVPSFLRKYPQICGESAQFVLNEGAGIRALCAPLSMVA